MYEIKYYIFLIFFSFFEENSRSDNKINMNKGKTYRGRARREAITIYRNSNIDDYCCIQRRTLDLHLLMNTGHASRANQSVATVELDLFERLQRKIKKILMITMIFKHITNHLRLLNKYGIWFFFVTDYSSNQCD